LEKVKEQKIDPRVLLVLLGLFITIALARLYTFREPLERDITTYAVIGSELLHGKKLYTELWDNKPPLVYATHAIFQLAFGYGPTAIYFMNLAFCGLVLFGVYWAGSVGKFGPAGGLWAAAFWTVISGDLSLQANQPNLELLMNAALIWAFAFLVRAGGRPVRWKTWGMIGLLLGCATLFNPVAATTVAFFGLAYTFVRICAGQRKTGFLRSLAVLIGIPIFLWIGVIVYFWLTGRFGDFRDCLLSFNLHYVSMSTAVLRFNWRLLFPQAVRFVWLLAVMALAGLVAGLRRRPEPWVIWLAYFGSSYLAVSLPGYFFPHYFQLVLPVLVVGGGWGIVSLADLFRRRWIRPNLVAGWLVLALLLAHEVPNYFIHPDNWSVQKYGNEIFVRTASLAQWLKERLKPDETFYEIGNETGLYFYSRKRPPSGVFFGIPLLSGPKPLAFKLMHRIISDLDREKPELVILRKYFYSNLQKEWPGNPLDGWVNRNYLLYRTWEDFILMAKRDGRLLEKTYYKQ
jgi:4-amino-4-deoxy-L-arabinose transferase-like glycosyltransferase